MTDADRPVTVEEIATLLDDEFSSPARLVRVRRSDHPDNPTTLGILVTIDPDEACAGPSPQPLLGVGEDEMPEVMPADMEARCQVSIARALVERAEEDLVVVTRRLPGPPEQQAQAQDRLAEARQELLVREAEVIAQGFERHR